MRVASAPKIIKRSSHVLFSARRVKISACVTVESSCVKLRPHPTFLAGGFGQQPGVSISRQHAWINHPPDRACTLRRHFQQLSVRLLLNPDCYFFSREIQSAAKCFDQQAACMIYPSSGWVIIFVQSRSMGQNRLSTSARPPYTEVNPDCSL